jgi:hypothetical protein
MVFESLVSTVEHNGRLEPCLQIGWRWVALLTNASMLGMTPTLLRGSLKPKISPWVILAAQGLQKTKIR